MPAGFATPLMPIKILLLADIHGNFPALQAIEKKFAGTTFDYIVNCGDSLVYAPFANEVLAWLAARKVISILGNTDKKVLDFIHKRPVKKPKNPEKRIMYTSTAETLDTRSCHILGAFDESTVLPLSKNGRSLTDTPLQLGIFHGSPEDPDEFLFANTPDQRFHELAAGLTCQIVVTGHSHTPYHKFLAGVHFINPGSAGRMFDGDPRASCATLEILQDEIMVQHWRIHYDIGAVIAAIRRSHLPEIYATMFLTGRKLN